MWVERSGGRDVRDRNADQPHVSVSMEDLEEFQRNLQ